VGQERACKLSYDGAVFEGKALLETKELIFRGGTRLKIPFERIKQVDAIDGELRVVFPPSQATFHLGDVAAKWASKIKNPPSRLDKLGIASGTRIHWVGRADAGFREEAEQRGAVFVRSKPDVTFLSASDKEALVEIAWLTPPVWIVYPKGMKEIREVDVIAAGRAAGLTDFRVASFSLTHTALKFVARKTAPK